ncbi:Gfo/Idh/MocA family protein [Paracoccus seriniphilus]|uniref:Predicted dehydrogenase n=1 Tax=Paracoccus seriniphilus TaxID=184748 RepID=A0A239PZ26_9RHOB|nr:Gfo/Idh/MocA family oxidoreductase [Paracoccus seriniphilus]WCR15731.1 Gfo/Idh/MocA family oxidoreductase [Paracoccus seriniphilus]SNT75589.1 Predicted dehydrogenase [Paracoccus seriniphilus]
MTKAEIGIGIVGGGYMGKAHSVAMASVAAVFDTPLRPRLEMICASSDESAEGYRQSFGFARATSDWRQLVADERVEAIIIATPQKYHREIAEAAFALGKPVMCEKPMGVSLEDSEAMVRAAQGHTNMVGYNYVRTPATQHVRNLVKDGVIGDVTWFRAEMTEDFLSDPNLPIHWRTDGMANGCIGDLAPHIFNAALALMGPIDRVIAEMETVHKDRPGGVVTNDDQVQMMCRFASGAMGHIFASRVATGRKNGYAYEIFGTKGSIRFDQEDQNAIWLYRMEGPEENRGFTKILTGPAHPDYKPFCLGPGHGTGYQDQIIIEAKDFLTAIHTKQPVWPTFEDGLAVMQVTDAALRSAESGTWQDVVHSQAR